MKVWKTRVDHAQCDLAMKGLLPADRQILRLLGRSLTAPGAADYCVQMAAMTQIDAEIMLARTRCPATTPIAKTVALRLTHAHADEHGGAETQPEPHRVPDG